MKYIKSITISIILILLINIVISSLNYLNIINNIKFNNLIILLPSVFISGIYLGTKTKEKGYLEGLKLSGIIIISLFILKLLTNQNITLNNLLLYLLILITTTLGSMIGINKKRD